MFDKHFVMILFGCQAFILSLISSAELFCNIKNVLKNLEKESGVVEEWSEYPTTKTVEQVSLTSYNCRHPVYECMSFTF